MSGFGGWFSLFGSDRPNDEIPFLFPLSVEQKEFIFIDVITLYSKILTDVFERSEGLSEDEQSVLWDNCLESESHYGLISLIAKAMHDKANLFLVYDKAVNVVRRATGAEEAQIIADYKREAKSSVGVYISFAFYLRTDMIRLYSALEYCTVGALNKSMNVSKAVQLKISDLRSTVALVDKAEAKSQAAAIVKGLSNGRDLLLDGKDIVETAKPDLTATQAAMEFLNEKRSFYLGMPCSYITGELNSGLGDTGQADSKAIDRGLKGYFVSIVKPVCQALFDKKVTFKSEDFMQLDSAINTFKVFEITGEELMTSDNKREILNKLFGLPADEPGGPKDPPPVVVVPPAPVDPNAKPKPQVPPKG